MNRLGFFVVGTILFASNAVFAWGGRGHQAICDAATQLVQNKDLKPFLVKRVHMMGHLCNIPDIYWRDLPKSQTELGNPTHFFEPDVVGAEIKDVPLDLKEATKFFSSKNHIDMKSPLKSVPQEMGSLWWRADQFYRRALDFSKKAVEAKADPAVFNSNIFQMITNMGLMGHHVADVSQPLHNSVDYDGYHSGHGGLHSYYEDAVVAAIDSHLVGKIVDEAKKKSKTYVFLEATSPVEAMRMMAEISYKEKDTLYKLDHVTKKSVLDTSGPLARKVPAERVAPEAAVKAFEPLIVQEMARSAALLAHFWDELYKKSGAPDLRQYDLLKFPIEPEFVAPDYLP